ncbi:MAG: hypothetical protein JST09_12650 [Bacteroidetes bacterium]|nr:hypothetical protein [Bacteroidota bacterium]MBS1611041.1 hypothetical protein [Bacteroidota bacterium]
METMKNAATIRSVISQTRNNTTTWIGHFRNESLDHFSGQTFKCPDHGILDNIQVYVSIIQRPGEVQLNLFEFDEGLKNWDRSVAMSAAIVSSKDEGNWIRFVLPDVLLSKDKAYGFRLHSNNAMIGIGEWARGNNEPCSFGQEWNADSNNRDGVFFTWFSLAFKVQMVA